MFELRAMMARFGRISTDAKRERSAKSWPLELNLLGFSQPSRLEFQVYKNPLPQIFEGLSLVATRNDLLLSMQHFKRQLRPGIPNTRTLPKWMRHTAATKPGLREYRTRGVENC